MTVAIAVLWLRWALELSKRERFAISVLGLILFGRRL
jgi:hypothetical protein